MKSPFVALSGLQKAKLSQWIDESGIISGASAIDFLEYDDEWLLYPLATIKKIASVCGMQIEVEDIDLYDLLASSFIHKSHDQNWISSIATVNQLPMEYIIRYLKDRRMEMTDHIRIQLVNVG